METIKLQANYLMTIFRNTTNGYTVARFVTYDQQEKEFTATGIIGELEEDTIYDLYGYYEEHARYGMQFHLERYEKTMPNDSNTLVRYFSSAQFPGIGRKIAQSIVEELGEEAISLIQEQPEILNRVSGISEKKKQIIINGIEQHNDLDDTVVFFTMHGISPQNIAKIQAKYGNDAIALVKENPYRMVADIDGIGFTTADKLAKILSFEDEHPYRIKAAVLASVLSVCMSTGDSYVSLRQIQRELNRMMGFHIENLSDYIDELVSERNLIVEEDRIYHHTQYDAECGIATFLSQFPYEELLSFEGNLQEEITALEEKYHITYEEKQKAAMQTFFDEPFAMISGGPGTGKTTIVKGILELAKKLYPNARIALCAPTGRAAKRLSQLSDGDATTIHALLKWDLESNQFTKGPQDPLELDILIVDEFSMVDAWVFYSLLRAGKQIAKILLIGDEDQLPSVGPGCVLKDLVESTVFPMIRLEKIFRQSEGSDVVTLAHEIREGSFDVLKQANDVAFFSCPSHEITKRVLQIVESAYEKGYVNQDIQVLAPMYNGVAGIDALNHALQELMNPPSATKRELRMGYRLFREGDKVLQLKNQPEDDVYNGDIGEIVEIIYASEDVSKLNKVVACFDEIIVEYSGEQIYHITHAYCTSIHKAQGSEYPIVIMPIVNDYRHMLQRRLLYTGVTRAKKSLVLLGQVEALQRCVSTKDHQLRKSTLKDRILTILR